MKNFANTEIGKLFLTLRNECLDKICHSIIGLQEQDIINISIKIIRDYNKKWNQEVEKNPELKKDGFLKVIKRHFEKVNMPDNFKSALKYL